MNATRYDYWSMIRDSLRPSGVDCLEWTGPQYEDGRGRVVMDGRSTTAARYVYTITAGEIPAGAHVTQSCGNLLCVTPPHLQLCPVGSGLGVKERLLRRVEKTESCWLWRGAKSFGGYGQMNVDGKRVGVHRVSYEVFKGDIPPGMEVDHLCFVRNCVNPDHLEAVTKYENTARSSAPTAADMRRLQGRPSAHGTSRRYHAGCRCDACFKWCSDHNRKMVRKRRLADPVIDCPSCGRQIISSNLSRHQEGWRCVKESKNRARREGGESCG